MLSMCVYGDAVTGHLILDTRLFFNGTMGKTCCYRKSQCHGMHGNMTTHVGWLFWRWWQGKDTTCQSDTVKIACNAKHPTKRVPTCTYWAFLKIDWILYLTICKYYKFLYELGCLVLMRHHIKTFPKMRRPYFVTSYSTDLLLSERNNCMIIMP